MINSRNLRDLHPTVRAMCERHIKACEAQGIDLLITSTYRDGESQQALYAQGRTTLGKIVTNAKAGQSFHNWRVAYDVVPLRNGKPVWGTGGEDGKLWRRVGAIGVACGLEWGGNFRSLPDMPHFQYTAGLTLKDFQNGRTLPLEA